jgi:hypothetical protein
MSDTTSADCCGCPAEHICEAFAGDERCVEFHSQANCLHPLSQIVIEATDTRLDRLGRYVCGKCGADITEQGRAFVQAIINTRFYGNPEGKAAKPVGLSVDFPEPRRVEGAGDTIQRQGCRRLPAP